MKKNVDHIQQNILLQNMNTSTIFKYKQTQVENSKQNNCNFVILKTIYFLLPNKTNIHFSFCSKFRPVQSILK